MKLFIMSFLGSIFINFSFIALSSFPTGSLGGHSNSVLGAVAEMNLFTFGLPIILPTVVLFLVWRIYEKRHIESGRKSYMTHYTLAMFIITIILTIFSGSLYRQSTDNALQQSIIKQQQFN